jgi:hypothetical protein
MDMRTGAGFARFAGIMVLCLGMISAAGAVNGQKKTKKPPLPPLPSGPTGPVPQIPLDSMAPVSPQVTYQSGQLTIVAPNSTLGDILRAVRKQTGADIDVPDAKERVVTHLGPGPARDVIAELLNGSRFNYVLLGSPTDPKVLTRIVLVARTGVDATPPGNPPGQQQAILRQGAIAPTPEQQEMPPDANDADAQPEDNPTPDDTAEQPTADGEQPVSTPEQPGVKTPQQLLQEMQQRQLQMQQQQQQSGTPGQPSPSGQVPPQPPQQER